MNSVVFYNVFYIAQLLKNLGFSYQKAAFVSDHLDEGKRQAWGATTWPQILRLAKERKALLLFGDEASFPQWGTLSYTWARRGHQPMVKTSGKRKGYKVFGLMEYLRAVLVSRPGGTTQLGDLHGLSHPRVGTGYPTHHADSGWGEVSHVRSDAALLCSAHGALDGFSCRVVYWHVWRGTKRLQQSPAGAGGVASSGH